MPLHYTTSGFITLSPWDNERPASQRPFLDIQFIPFLMHREVQMQKYHAFGFLIILFGAQAALAGFTNFEDLAEGRVFMVGEVTTSQGVTFETLGDGVSIRRPSEVPPPRPPATGGTTGGAGGSGVELRVGRSTALVSFDIPDRTRHISMLFGAYDPNAAFVLNGVESPRAGGFSRLDGWIIAGVLVSVIPSTMPPFGRPDVQGELVLTGQIDSFLLRGPELSIDNVRIAIPEPAAALLVVTGCIALVGRTRARRFAQHFEIMVGDGRNRGRRN
jgi:hypothetical protein